MLYTHGYQDMSNSKKMHKLITILLILLLSSCTQNTGQMSFMVNFSKSSKVLTQSEKEELKKKAELTLKNLEDQDLNSGVLEVTIK